MRLLDILTSPWAILPDKLEEIQAIYATHLRGEKIDIKGIEAKLGRSLENPPQEGYEVVKGVAILPIQGVMAKRMNMFSQISGGMSTELFGRDLRAALADPAVHAIILDTDSPGGTVAGTPELAALVHAARDQKPIVAHVNGTMASAAYWVGSAARQIFISSGVAQVGSIGILARHMDVSRAEEARGIKTTLIYAGRYKAIANEFAPLSEEGRASMQSHVDYLYSQFVGAVASHRGVPVSTVLERMADGKVFIGDQAIEAGLVDGVSTLEELIDTLADGRSPQPVKSAAARATIDVGFTPRAARSEPSTGAGDAPKPNINEDQTMDMNKLKAEHPGLVEALLKEGRDGVDAKALRAEGATAERDRIKAIFALNSPGHEALVQAAMFDGASTAGDVAMKIVAADNAKRGDRLEAIRKDGAEAGLAQPGAANLPKAADTSHLPVEERCKNQWDSDAKVRGEFTSLEAYTAFVKAEESGRVRVVGRKSA